jgi:hypothetical protein
MKLLRIFIFPVLIVFLLSLGLVIAVENRTTSFLMEKTQFKPVSGDCLQGQGVLEITGFEGNPYVVGTYIGECKKLCY